MTITAPDTDTCYENFLALHPRGKVWQTHDGAIDTSTSVFRQFWYGIAGVWQGAEQKVVDALAEWFCNTTADDTDGWLADYEDPCGLAAIDLCLKVQEQNGGQSLEYYSSVATALGFDVEFSWIKGDNTAYPDIYSTLLAVVNSTTSPSLGTVPVGRFVVGRDHLGGNGVDLIECVLNRIVPAHIALEFMVI